MTRGSIALFLILLITSLLLVVLTFDQHRVLPVSSPDNEELQDEECKQKLEYMASHSTPRTDYTIVRLNHTTQRLRGKILLKQGIKVAQFLSVPFADKPKRFRKPEPVPAWTGVRDSTHWPPLCVQNKLHQYDYLTQTLNRSVSEDCLFLNIWTPHVDLVRLVNRTNRVQSFANSLLPVVIFIHGGAFSYMGISYHAHNGAVLSALGNVVFVAISYRVGLFGFFHVHDHHPQQSLNEHDLYPKNVGLYDQIAAIQWVSDNIHYFGGDRTSITLHGQSAGAISIGLLMLSPLSSHLFHRAILQSASPVMPKQLFTAEHYARVIDLANCSVTENAFEPGPFLGSSEEESGELENNSNLQRDQKMLEIRCLEKLPAESLNRIQAQVVAESAISFSPAIPSDFLSDFPSELLKHGNFPPKDILLGANAHESALFLHQEFPAQFPLKPSLNLTRPQIVQIIRRLSGGSPMAERQFVGLLFDMFSRNNITTDDEIARQFFIILSDFTFKGPVLKFAKSWSEVSPNSNVFLYMFNQSEAQYPNWVGPAHWIEMDFVFGIPLQEPNRFSKDDQQLSIRMIQAWTHFAKTGQMLPQLGLSWPPFSSTTGQHMVLQSSVSALGANLETQYFSYFDLLYDVS